MSATPQPPDSTRTPAAAAQPGAVAVLSAHGAFRALLVLLALWSFFEGFALFTGSVHALSLGGSRASERVAGGQMLIFVPVYGLIAWNRERYRLMLWLPYATQLAIIVPLLLNLFAGPRRQDGLLVLIVSIIFFSLLVYFWRQSHPLDFFVEDEAEFDEDEDEADDPGDGAAPPASATAPARPLRARDLPRRTGRFRRRDR